MIKYYSCLAYYKLQWSLRSLNTLLVCSLDKILGAQVLKQTKEKPSKETPTQ